MFLFLLLAEVLSGRTWWKKCAAFFFLMILLYWFAWWLHVWLACGSVGAAAHVRGAHARVAPLCVRLCPLRTAGSLCP